jgi:hypothetical protein
MSNKTQCVNVPPGASGSSIISAKLFVFAGAPLHFSCGETFSAEQVNFAGMFAPSVNAAVIRVNGAAVAVGAAVGAVVAVGAAVAGTEVGEGGSAVGGAGLGALVAVGAVVGGAAVGAGAHAFIAAAVMINARPMGSDVCRDIVTS